MTETISNSIIELASPNSCCQETSPATSVANDSHISVFSAPVLPSPKSHSILLAYRNAI